MRIGSQQVFDLTPLSAQFAQSAKSPKGLALPLALQPRRAHTKSKTHPLERVLIQFNRANHQTHGQQQLVLVRAGIESNAAITPLDYLCIPIRLDEGAMPRFDGGILGG